MSHCKIHNVGFYSPEPRAIYSIALQRDDNKLAIARSDASIEIWDLSNLTFIERTIPPNLENFSIEGLCWCGKRLFSVGLHGFLIEYDLYKLNVKDRWIVTGESATCLDVSRKKTQIAVGTEQGYINLFHVTEEGTEFEKFLDKQEGRIICIKFDSTGEFLVTGSLNAIRVWNINSGHAIHKMQLGRSEANTDTVVWCLEVMSDFTIFSGDSRGVLTLWDGKVGGYIENYQSHKADIIALCVSEKEDSLYCAGVDPLITNYQKVKVGQWFKWVKSIQRKIHEHDVRALVYHKNKLYSGGIDSYLACSYHPPKTLLKYAHIMQPPCIQVAPKARLILLRYPRHIEVWSLAETENTENNFRGMVQLKTNPKKLVAIQRIGKNWNDEDEGEGILCSCISSNGNWIFMSTTSGFRLYRLQMEKGKPNLIKVDELDDCNVPCVQAVFNDKHNQLIVALDNGNIVIYDLEDGTPFVSHTILSEKKHLSDTVTFLTTSSCGKYLVAGDPKSNIVIWSYVKDGYSYLTKLPKYSMPPTALAVNSVIGCLVVAYADGKIIEYNIKQREFTKFSRLLQNSLPSSWKTRTYPIRSIAFDARKSNIILLHDDSNIMIINKDKKYEEQQPEVKIARAIKSDLLSGVDSDQPRFRIVEKYKHLVCLSYLSGDELVAVEVNPLAILEKLPPAYAQKTFGTK